MDWSRGEVLGRGSFATVSLAHVRRPSGDPLPPLMAVKSTPLSASAVLRHEEAVLSRLDGCPYLIRCFCSDVVSSRTEESYNIFLEYAGGGSLRDLLLRSGGRFPEPAVRRYTRAILLGLHYVHACGYAHCDVKLQNVLVFDGGAVKISDFGLAKKADDRAKGFRGTPLYMSPEATARDEHGAPGDIWALGCAVVEMATGRPPWPNPPDGDAWGLLFKIAFSDASPEIPADLSEKGKDFLRLCFAKDPAQRSTAEMLLSHPFVATTDAVEDIAGAPWECTTPLGGSPRNVLEIPSYASSSPTEEENIPADSSDLSPTNHILELASPAPPNWASSSRADSGWIEVRAGVLIQSISP
ncbi:mitogen-activated protein kinase kinase kinase 20-like [Curcuma longa]|uniref:mitogen-activated protein kinase kinase kinase 20-like n=1 Tax=Curcuma longa TaxID=136217 RepID=UPI003D9EC414